MTTTAITDEQMQEMLTKTKAYCLVLLKPGPKMEQPGVEKIIWEHGRRNFALRAQGLMPIVCPVTVESDVSGLCIFNAPPDQVVSIMNEDPGVQAGVFIFEILPCLSFAGDRLP